MKPSVLYTCFKTNFRFRSNFSLRNLEFTKDYFLPFTCNQGAPARVEVDSIRTKLGVNQIFKTILFNRLCGTTFALLEKFESCCSGKILEVGAAESNNHPTNHCWVVPEIVSGSTLSGDFANI